MNSLKHSYLLDLFCPDCGNHFDSHQLQTICQVCQAPLNTRYDLVSLSRDMNPEDISKRHRSIWRWKELLPVKNPAFYLSAGEGDTPLLKLTRLGAQINLPHLYIKDESANACGTIQARGMAISISKASELGVRDLVIGGAGNSGATAALYAALGGIKAHLMLPKDGLEVYKIEANLMSADVKFIYGSPEEARHQASLGARENDWFNMETFLEPYHVDGKKTIALELAEAFQWMFPEVIIYPAGKGSGLVGIWKAYKELSALGWLQGKPPKIILVQSEQSARLVTAFQEQKWRQQKSGNSVAIGLRAALQALHESEGTALCISQVEIEAARQQMAKTEGVLLSPNGAVALAGLIKALKDNFINQDESVVLVNSGSGLKYIK